MKSNSKPAKSARETPMMRQYLQIKAENQDAILFFRLGDFYEMFYEDAEVASKILDLTLTTRNKNSAEPVPLCGIPYHAASGYIAKLIAAGKKVAICEQVEDPKTAKGIVKRSVTRVISPGVVLDDQSLSAKNNNFILAFVKNEKGYSLAVSDVSTGLLEYKHLTNVDSLLGEIGRYQIREVIYTESLRDSEEISQIRKNYPELYHHAESDLYADEDYATDLVTTYYKVSGIDSLSLESDTSVRVLGLVLGYLQEIKILQPDLLDQPKLRSQQDHLILDEATTRNLELFRTMRNEERGTLLWHLDDCQTSFGSRTLAEFIRTPLTNVSHVNKRHDAIEELCKRSDVRIGLREALHGVSDLERLSNKFLTGSAHARDAMALMESFSVLPLILQHLSSVESELLKDTKQNINEFKKLKKRIHETVADEPGLSLKDGGIIKQGFHKELDELRHIEKSGKDVIASMEAKEKKDTGIPSLKIRYNNVFGYYIEVTNTHKDKIPESYIRKQTLTNAERYITDELKKYESKVLGASERIKKLEYEIFSSLREEIKEDCAEIKKTSKCLAHLDVFQSLAHVSIQYDYVRPAMSGKPELNLKEARHAILERLQIGEEFIPNDICLNADGACEMIITGPNMAGKSTIMRMTALVVIMAQIGCFVPCSSATIGICDQVFTRVGAHDHLQKGMSTFMVEMVETAKILREATKKSLILLDEIGRGTSTFDGLSIAWAVAEDLHDRLQARTLFATHYHELCDLAETRKGIQNHHMSVKEWNGQIIFLRKLKSGGTNRSYGVAVASMAGLPNNTINRAKEVLKLLEKKDLSFKSEIDHHTNQMSLFEHESEASKIIREIDPNDLTPKEALDLVYKLKDVV